MAKNWVFDALVSDENDLEGLLAYALYKCRKSELAKSLRRQKLSEQTVQQRLSDHHDNIVSNAMELDGYRDQAAVLLGEIRVGFTDPLEKQIAQLKAAHLSNIAKAEKSAVKKFKDQLMKTVEKDGKVSGEWWRLRWFLPWLFSGVPSALSTVVFSVLLLAMILVTKTSQDEKSAALDNGYNDLKSALLPAKTSNSSLSGSR